MHHIVRATAPPVLGVACEYTRCLSTVAQDVVGEMILYARQNYKGAHDQAIDIVKSGLSFKNTGPDAGRLYLAQAEIEADRSRWGAVADLAQQAASAAFDAAPSSPEDSLKLAEVELAASVLRTRAHLVKLRSAEAFTAAQTSMEVARKSLPQREFDDKRWRGLVTACSVAGLVQHAAGDFELAAESFAQLNNRLAAPPLPPPPPANQSDSGGTPSPAAAEHLASLDPLSPVSPAGAADAADTACDHLVAPSLKQAALFALAAADAGGGDSAAARLEGAMLLAGRAGAGAHKAAELAVGGAGVFQSPVFCGEAVADAHLAAAQVSMRREDWDAAEAQLTQALEAAEGVGGEGNPRVALVLLLLGQVYSRSARVTLAEGLYRESAKLLGLGPTGGEDVQLVTVHPTVGALLAWRFAQLLSVLPNRATEATAWRQLAGVLYEEAPIGGKLRPEGVFGEMEALKGGDKEGGVGVVVDLMCRRVLPRQA